MGLLRESARPCSLALVAALAVSGCGDSGDPVPPGGGLLQWVVAGGGQGAELAFGVTVTGGNDLVVAGATESATSTYWHGDDAGAEVASAGASDLLLLRLADVGTLEWALTDGGPEVQAATGVASWPDGRLLVAGGFSEEATFGGTVTGELGGDGPFVAVYGGAGRLERAWLGAFPVGRQQVATWADGSYAVAASFEGEALLGEGEERETLLSCDVATAPDIYVARYGADGSLAWAARLGGPGYDVLDGVEPLDDGALVVVGQFEDVATFGESAEPIAIGETRHAEMLLARIDGSGGLEWARQSHGGAESVEGLAMACLDDGGCYVTGSFFGSTTLGRGEPNETTLRSHGENRDAFLASYGADGSLEWAVEAGGEGEDDGTAVAAFEDGSVVAAGTFRGGDAVFGEGEPAETLLRSTGSRSVFVARFDRTGGLEWARGAGGEDAIGVEGIVSLSAESCAIVGWFSDTAVFGRGEPGEARVVSAGDLDLYVARFGP